VHCKVWAGCLGLILSLWFHAPAFSQPQEPAGPPGQGKSTHSQLPSVRLGDVFTPYNLSTVAVPVFLKNYNLVDGLHLTLDYDASFLGYAWDIVRDDNWRVENASSYGNRRETIVLRKNSRTVQEPGGQDEVHALDVVFSLKPVDPEQQPFRLRTSVSIGNAFDASQVDMTYFYVLGAGEAARPVATELHSGSATIYFHDGVEVDWGAITRTEQDFYLNLYLTYLSPDRHIYSVGVDYDELFLNLIDVQGLSPPLEDKDKFEVSSSEIAPHKVRAAFDLSISSSRDTSGPKCRVPVAVLHFLYNGTEPPDNRLFVEPKLLLPGALGGGGQNTPRNDGGGASYGDNIPGIVELLPAYFVRGNADSSVKVFPDGTLSMTPDLTDAFLILKAIFVGRSDITCEDAADVNNNGVVEISDAISLLNHFWRSGPPPTAPYPNPGVDTDTDDSLDCAKPLPFFKSMDAEEEEQ